MNIIVNENFTYKINLGTNPFNKIISNETNIQILNTTPYIYA